MSRSSSSERFRTEREVYNQLRWDARADLTQASVLYRDGEHTREMPFAAWTPHGPIPWHRICAYRLGGAIIWDRDARIDRLDDILGARPSTPALTSPTTAKTPALRAMYQYVASQHTWNPLPATPPRPVLRHRLRVVTYNILNDHGDERLQTPARTAATLQLLSRIDADLIALQEVTPTFLDALLNSPWVRHRFAISATLPREVRYGLVLLSRMPCRIEALQLSRGKEALLATVHVNERTLIVGVVHLTSDFREDACRVRLSQMTVLWQTLHARLDDDTDLILMGDFNCADGDAALATCASCVDTWRRCRPDHPGLTYDPLRNNLAVALSHSGHARRLDRILLGAHTAWQPLRAQLIGEAPILLDEGPIHPSDHFGLDILLQTTQTLTTLAFPNTTQPVHQSALVIIPPQDQWAPIQALRQAYDPKVERWMPHINLLYGFIHEDGFDDAAAVLEQALIDMPPFEIHLDRFDCFEHRASTTLWLRPETTPHNLLHTLQARVLTCFPTCDEVNIRSKQGFTPHLTVGQHRGDERTQTHARLDAWQRDWTGVTFTVDRIALISRRGDEPFTLRRTVRLSNHPPKPPPAPPPRDDVIQLLELACEVAVDAPRVRRHRGWMLQVLGSTRLGVASTHSDLDVLCIGPWSTSPRRFFDRLRQQLTQLDPAIRPRPVLDAVMPTLQASILGVDVDVQYARAPHGVATPDLVPITRTQLARTDDTHQRALAGPFDIDMLLADAARQGSLDAFRHMLRDVRAWTTARQLSGNAFGLPSSIAYAIAAAYTWHHHPNPDTCARCDLLRTMIETLQTWPWPSPLHLPLIVDPDPLHPHDVMPILTPAGANCTRNVTLTTLQSLRIELQRAVHILSDDDDDVYTTLCTPVDKSSHAARVAIEAQANTQETLTEVAGWVRRHALTWVLMLEIDGAVVRPYPKPMHVRSTDAAHHTCWTFGLDGQPDPNALRVALANIQTMLSECSIATLTITLDRS